MVRYLLQKKYIIKCVTSMYEKESKKKIIGKQQEQYKKKKEKKTQIYVLL